jgi:site-specific DNA-methyltransferase (adenine-specific)
MAYLCRLVTPPNGIVLDPFTGSGTTGVAAIQCGRRFVGWEREPKYHAVATKRLSEAREQPSLALGAPAKAPKTGDLFGAKHQQQGDSST